MRKILNIFILMIIIISAAFTCVNANDIALIREYNEMYTIEIETISNKNDKDFDFYILLPKSYIMHAIENDNLDIEYNGAYTLIDNYIPSINVDEKSINEEVYIEKDKEYVQILLEKNSEGIYEFDILSSYKNMDMKFRVKNIQKDYIIHIDNFEIRNEICEIEYDYDKDIIKQPDVKVIPLATKILIAILIITILVGIIAYIKQRR